MTRHPELNVESVQRRLVAIRERLDELRQLEGVTADRLREDWLTRAAVERVPTQLVELAAQVNTHIVAVSGKVLRPSTANPSPPPLRSVPCHLIWLPRLHPRPD